jgi:hypothetical protein
VGENEQAAKAGSAFSIKLLIVMMAVLERNVTKAGPITRCFIIPLHFAASGSKIIMRYFIY